MANINTKKPQRNTSIELLRIVSMVMIVSCHFATHGGFTFVENEITAPRLWWLFLEMGGNLGVDIFVLISGYFLITNRTEMFDIKRILKFWGQVVFYSVIIYCTLCISGKCQFTGTALKESIFPITYEAWWFASAYFVLYLLHPFINRMIAGLKIADYRKLLVIMLTFWCIIPTLTEQEFQGNKLLWFITLYCVAGYIRLHGIKSQIKLKYFWSGLILSYGLRYLSSIIILLMKQQDPTMIKNYLFYYGQQSVLTFTSAVCIFVIFVNLKIRYSTVINVIASASFGVYLIHDSNYIRPILWTDIFKNADYQNTLMIIPYSIIAVLVVYVVCTIVELVRQAVVERAYMRILEKDSDI